jgi:hypothetical protein
VEIFPHRLLFATRKVRLAQPHKVLGEQKLVVHIFPKNDNKKWYYRLTKIIEWLLFQRFVSLDDAYCPSTTNCLFPFLLSPTVKTKIMKTPNNAYIYLTYAGCLPFLICTFFLVSGLNNISYLGDTIKILQVYSLVIASFMAGVHWGQYLTLIDECPIYLPIASNTITLFIWISFLVMPIYWYLITLIFVFVLILLIDVKLAKKKQLGPLYFRSRIMVTIVVSVSLVFSIITIK